MNVLRGRKAVIGGLAVGLVLSGLMASQALSLREPPAEVPDPPAGRHGVLLDLGERVINLGAGGYRYAKIGLTIELRPTDASFYELTGEARTAAEEAALTEHGSTMPLLLDALGMTVTAQDSRQLVLPEGRAELKSALLGSFRQVLGDRAVLNVYFTDLVMQ